MGAVPSWRGPAPAVMDHSSSHGLTQVSIHTFFHLNVLPAQQRFSCLQVCIKLLEFDRLFVDEKLDRRWPELREH